MNRVRPFKIAVFRALQLGDMLCAVPAFRALRTTFPDAEITLIGLPWAKDFTKRFATYIDNFIAFPGYPGLPEQDSNGEKFNVFIQEVQKEHFDLVIQMHGDGSITNAIISQFGAKHIAGSYKQGNAIPNRKTFTKYRDDIPEVHRNLRALKNIGIRSLGNYLEFPITKTDKEKIKKIPEYRLLINTPYICIHPGARDPKGRWDPKNFAFVADTLITLGYEVVITGVAEEKQIVQSVLNQMKYQARDFSGKLSLGETAALLSDAQLVISNSTGIAHLVDALQLPSIVVFLKADYKRWAPLNRKMHKVVFNNEEASQLHVLEEAIKFLEKKELMKNIHQGLPYFNS